MWLPWVVTMGGNYGLLVVTMDGYQGLSHGDYHVLLPWLVTMQWVVTIGGCHGW